MNTYNQVSLATRSLSLAATRTIKVNTVTANYIALFCVKNDNSLIYIRFKQTYAALAATCIAICMMAMMSWGAVYAASTDPIPPTTTAVKWHPGHYFTLYSSNKDNPNYLARVYNDLKATPALRGAQIRYEWADLETAKGVYDFTAIDARLAELAAIEKRLVIMIQTKSFSLDTALVPDYLKTSAYEGGVFTYESANKDQEGQNIKLWNSMVRDRMIALIRALGKRYNSHPYFEGIGLTETAMGQPVIALTSTQVDVYYANLLNINKKMREHFPNTMTFQFTNYPRPLLESFINGLKEMGTALGGPDTFIQEPGLLYTGAPKGVYNYYPVLSGIIPMTPSVMPGNYRNTRVDGTGYEPTVSELLAFARDKLKANYIFWHRDVDYYPQVLEMLNWSEQTSDPAGGLNPACPTAYSSCIN